MLLPDGRLALRVFEPRYLDMVARCLRGENRFGVVAIREGAEVGAATTYEFGTTAEIVDWHQESGGLLGIVAAGRDAVSLARDAPRARRPVRRRGRLARAAAAAAAAAPRTRRSPRCCERLIEPLPLYRGVAPAFDDAAWVGGRLIELLPLALAFKQSLLETRGRLASGSTGSRRRCVEPRPTGEAPAHGRLARKTHSEPRAGSVT